MFVTNPLFFGFVGDILTKKREISNERYFQKSKLFIFNISNLNFERLFLKKFARRRRRRCVRKKREEEGKEEEERRGDERRKKRKKKRVRVS